MVLQGDRYNKSRGLAVLSCTRGNSIFFDVRCGHDLEFIALGRGAKTLGPPCFQPPVLFAEIAC